MSKNGTISAADWCSKCGNFCDCALINGVYLSACCVADVLSRRPALKGTIPIEKITEAVQKVKDARQVGGDHYSRMEIEPIDFIVKNNLGWHEGNVLKYICRHRGKGGAEDIRKAIDYLRKLLASEYGEAE